MSLGTEEIYKIYRQGFQDGLAVRLAEYQQPLRIGRAEMAKRIGISQRTLSNWTRKRMVPFDRIGSARGRSIVLFEIAAVNAALRRWRYRSVGE